MNQQNYIRSDLDHSRKSELISHTFKMIRQKKIDLTNQLRHQPNELPLPAIHTDKLYLHRLTQASQPHQAEDLEDEEHSFDEKTPKVLFRPIFEDREQANSRSVLPKSKNKLDTSKIVVDIKRHHSKPATNRIKSEHIEQSQLAPLKTELEQPDFSQNRPANSLQARQKAKQDFITSLEKVPKSIKHRTEVILSQPITALEKFNPFFSRNYRIVNVCLMKVGKIVFRNSSPLYKLGEEANSFFIILSGKVKLSNGGLKRVCQTGQTVLEQALFQGKLKKIALQRAKTVGSTFLLEIGVRQFCSIREQMIKHGFKMQMQQMQAIVKRNYIVKNWLRNKVRALQDI